MSYITLTKEGERKGMTELAKIAGMDAFMNEEELRESLHDIIKSSTGHDDVLVQGLRGRNER